ncbi:MAG: hypothetical protein FWG09_01485 [Synergistaceae bacterium]|nr:hypothetical protein [Synergistaceae bacterium]
MKLPRLIIAGEHKTGFVPPSILLLAAMKRSGIPLHVFYCGFSPIDVRLLQSISEESVTVINLKTCTNIKMVKTLFETSAMSNKLNVIVCDLGQRAETARDSYIDTIASDLAFALDCSIILCCYAENQPRPLVKIVGEICSAIEKQNPVRIDGAIFVNPFDPHSFQLTENNIGMNFRWSTFGYIPSELEPPIPTIESLSSVGSYTRGTFSLRAVAGRIAQMQGQIDYLALEAIGKYNQEWISTGGVAHFQKAISPKVAMIKDLALTGEGNNAELLFKSFGCQVYQVSAKEMLSQSFDMYYFPDGLGYIAAESFNSTEKFASTLKSAILNNRIVFANGASALIFGEKFMAPDGSEAKGLGILPVMGNYSNLASFSSPSPVICASAKTEGLLLQGDEKINAYMVPNIALESHSKSLHCSFAATGIVAGSTGYEEHNAILAGVCIDLWSNIDVIRRLFYAT